MNLFQACTEGRLEEVRAALARGEDVNMRVGGYRRTPLMEAVTGEQEDIADLLLQQPGLDVALRDTCGNSALHLAAIRGSQGLVRRLTQAVGVRIQCILRGADKQGWAQMESARSYKTKFGK